MIRLVAFLLVLAATAFGISWLLDRPGEVTVLWLGQRIETSVFVALGVVFLACVVFTLLWSIFAFVFRVPGLVSLARRARKHARGHDALSRGMIAVGAGDLRSARRAAGEASRAIPHEPLGLLLRAQVAQMEGNRPAAEAAFAEMAARQSTKLLGLRGLHVEAQRRGEADTAHRYAQEAHRIAPLPWAGEAIVTHHATQSQWTDALAIVESNARAKTIDRPTAERQRAVLETAIAQDSEFVDAEGALKTVRTAVKRAPDLVPAVTLAARLLSRRGDFRAASKMVERAWDEAPHPELAAAYLAVRPGDSNADRFARATALARRMPDHPESRLLVAEAALATRDFARAREAMRSLVAEDARPTTRQCLMMADIEQTEHGETGLLREWLSRASRAPRDPTWVTDGVTAVRWAPASPVTGRLDAFRWETPRQELGSAPREPVTAPVSFEAPAMALPLPTVLDEDATPPSPRTAARSDEEAGSSQTGEGALPILATNDSRDVSPPVPLVESTPVSETPPVRSLFDRLAFEPTAAPTSVSQSDAMVVVPANAAPSTLESTSSAPVAGTIAAAQPKPVIFPLATSPDDPGPRPKGAPYSGGFHS